MRRPSKRVLAAGALVVAAAGVTVVVLATGDSGPGTTARAASTSTSTTRIKRQDLVETDTESGTLGYADTRSLINRLSGTITWLPSQGAVIKPDHALYKVDGKPVILMTGQQPVYRVLGPGITAGTDIRQLESTLQATGYDASGAMTVNDTWSAATTAAVKRWQDAHGLKQTGSIGLGRIIFLPGERRIASMSVTLGGSTSGGGGGGGSNVSASDAQIAAGAGNRALIAYVSSRDTAQATTPTTTPTTPTTPATTPTTPTTPATTPTTPRTPTTTAPATTTPATTTPATTTPSNRGNNGTSTGDTPSSSGGDGSSSVANAIMTTTSTKRVVKVALDTTKSSLAKNGARVSVELPSGDVVHGRISSVGKVATSTSTDTGQGGGGGEDTGTATIAVTIHLSTIRTALDAAPVTVGFEQSRRKNVLAIPVTALLAQPGGAYAVEVVDAGGNRRVVPVQTGLYTSGFVEIEGEGLRPGMRVTNAAV